MRRQILPQTAPYKIHRNIPARLAWAIAAVALMWPALAPAGVSFTEINPDRSTQWTPTDGHGASGGRFNNVAGVSGTNLVFYGASEWGGLWKTIDGGVTWSHLSGHVPMATWDVAVDPTNSNRVFATSLYDGRQVSQSGIEVSIDGGTTWTHPPTATPSGGFTCAGMDEPSAFGIGIRPDASNNVFVGTNCGIAVSHNSGAAWAFVDPDGNGVASEIWDVVVQGGGPSGQGIVDICGLEGHFRSTDGGATWTGHPLPFGTFNTRRCSLAVSPDEPDVLFVADDINDKSAPNFHSVWESDDAGASWNLLGKPYLLDADTKRLPFLVTNNRSDTSTKKRFDLWYGEMDLWRVTCESPPPAGRTTRCPAAPSCSNYSGCSNPGQWDGPYSEKQGAHGDSGDLEFDRTAAVDACPMIYASDGGVYYRDPSTSDCQAPMFKQPDVSPHTLWLWGMARATHTNGDEGLYCGVQDDGSWASTNALDAAPPGPSWKDGPSSDSFTMTADANRVVWYNQDGLHVEPPGLTWSGFVNAPTPCLMDFRFINAIERADDKQYVVVTRFGDLTKQPACNVAGIFYTADITASPVVWTQLGVSTSPANPCGIRASRDPVSGDPVFYVQAGSCNGGWADNVGDELWKYTGTAASQSWTRVDNNGLASGIAVFGVDPNDAARLYAAEHGGPRMMFSTNGGATWQPDVVLDLRMTGRTFPSEPVVFKYSNSRGVTTDYGFNATFIGYIQPSLVAFDPDDPNILVAGARDAGLFLSTDGGRNWGLLTDPLTPGASGIPHIPRPWFAQFKQNAPGDFTLFVGTQGRGVWRLRIKKPAANTGGPYVTPEGTDVTLDASGSSDPDGQALSYAWDLDNNGVFETAGQTAVFNNVGQDGVFTVGLKVTAGGVSSYATTTVTVTNVAPSVSLSSDAPKPEAQAVTVSGTVSDPGWLDPLTATIDWGDGTPAAPLSGALENIRPDATLTFQASHMYGDNGTFNAQVCASDDDTTTCQTIPLTITNVAPTAQIDKSGAVVWNGKPVFIKHAGQPQDFSGRSTDPGSDDLALSWDWGDGPPSPDVITTYLVNPPNTDPFPSPSIQPRDVTDAKTHAFGQACLYEVVFQPVDDDGGSASDKADVVITGNAANTRSAGYWKRQMASPSKAAFSTTTLQCYLEIAGFMSGVFDEIRDASTFANAAVILNDSKKGYSKDALDRQLLAAWLNFANGSLDLGTLVDINGDGVLDESFGNAMSAAEAVRLDPNATSATIENQKNIIEAINLRDEK